MARHTLKTLGAENEALRAEINALRTQILQLRTGKQIMKQQRLTADRNARARACYELAMLNPGRKAFTREEVERHLGV